MQKVLTSRLWSAPETFGECITCKYALHKNGTHDSDVKVTFYRPVMQWSGFLILNAFRVVFTACQIVLVCLLVLSLLFQLHISMYFAVFAYKVSNVVPSSRVLSLNARWSRWLLPNICLLTLKCVWYDVISFFQHNFRLAWALHSQPSPSKVLFNGWGVHTYVLRINTTGVT